LNYRSGDSYGTSLGGFFSLIGTLASISYASACVFALIFSPDYDFSVGSDT
jgi:hypothetical protein